LAEFRGIIRLESVWNAFAIRLRARVGFAENGDSVGRWGAGVARTGFSAFRWVGAGSVPFLLEHK
jgi:hypothetical protein